MGCRTLRELDYRPRTDSAYALRVRAGGLIPIGRTNVPEMAVMGTTEPQLYGPTHNPWDLGSRRPVGRRAAPAPRSRLGSCPVAHANDISGSIRIPASHCGVVGLKADAWPGGDERRRRAGRDGDRGRADAQRPRHGGDGRLARAHVAVVAGPGVAAPARRRGGRAGRGAACRRLDRGLQRQSGRRRLRRRGDAGRHAAGERWAARSRPMRRRRCPTRPSGTTPRWRSASPPRPRPRPGRRGSAMRSARPISNRARGRWCRPAIRCPPVELYELIERLQAHAARALPGSIGTTCCHARPSPPRPGLLGDYLDRYVSGLGSAFTRPLNVTGQPAMSIPLGWPDDGLPRGVQLIAAYGREDLLIRVAIRARSRAPLVASEAGAVVRCRARPSRRGGAHRRGTRATGDARSDQRPRRAHARRRVRDPARCHAGAPRSWRARSSAGSSATRRSRCASRWASMRRTSARSPTRCCSPTATAVPGTMTQPRVEPEVALRFARDVRGGRRPRGRARRGRRRHAASKWSTRCGPTTGSGSRTTPPTARRRPAWCSGPSCRSTASLDVEVTLLVDGEPFGSGRGSDASGHPADGVVWLVEQLAAQGRAAPRRRRRDHRRPHTRGALEPGSRSQARSDTGRARVAVERDSVERALAFVAWRTRPGTVRARDRRRRALPDGPVDAGRRRAQSRSRRALRRTRVIPGLVRKHFLRAEDGIGGRRRLPVGEPRRGRGVVHRRLGRAGSRRSSAPPGRSSTSRARSPSTPRGSPSGGTTPSTRPSPRGRRQAGAAVGVDRARRARRARQRRPS